MWVLVRWVASIADEATSPQAITSWQGHRDTRGALIITGENYQWIPRMGLKIVKIVETRI